MEKKKILRELTRGVHMPIFCDEEGRCDAIEDCTTIDANECSCCDINHIVRAFNRGIEFQKQKSPWISVEDDLPNNPKYLKQPDYSPWVIAVTENGEVLPAQMIVMHEKWIWHSRFSRKHEDIVLWMPIPKFEEDLL